jgi:hypothetical protein
VNPRVGGSHGDLAQALALAVAEQRGAFDGRAAAGLPLELPLAAQVLGSSGVNVHAGVAPLTYGDRL